MPGCQSRTQAVVGVFQCDAILRREFEFVQHPVVDIRRGFFVRHDVAAAVGVEIFCPILPQSHFQQGRDVLRGGGGCNGESDAGFARILDQLLDAGA